jgi:hypothetical protein
MNAKSYEKKKSRRDLFILDLFQDSPVNSDKASAQVGADAGEILAGSPEAALLKVKRWIDEGSRKALDGA